MAHVERYWARVRQLGLRPSNVPNNYVGPDGFIYGVPDPTNRTPEQLDEIIEKLKERLGVFSRGDAN